MAPFSHRRHLESTLDGWHKSIPTDHGLLLQGGCREGPDAWAKSWGQSRGIHSITMDALWDFQRVSGNGASGNVYSAGPKRNMAMAQLLMALRWGDANIRCFAMPYGKASGTRGMMKILRVFEFPIEDVGDG